MSNIEKKKQGWPPTDMPDCACFSGDNEHAVMLRCADVATAAGAISAGFEEVAHHEQLCAKALPFLLETSIVSILTRIARAEGPALQCGTQEMQWEAERLLSGLEGRVLKRMRETYELGRELGMTEETVNAMRERDSSGGEVQ